LIRTLRKERLQEKTGTTVELLAFIVNETSKPLTEMVYGLNEVNRNHAQRASSGTRSDRGLYGAACIY
jgi:hypothetical protein